MPELPEVETVCRGLQAAVVGKTIAEVQLSKHRLRFPLPEFFVDRLAGRRIVRVERRAKYLLIYLDKGLVLLAHLGMSGRFRLSPAKVEKHDHVTFAFTDGSGMAFNDARRFGCMDLISARDIAAHRLLVHLGPEPLGKDFSAAYLRGQLAARRGPVKPVLMDQKLVVGVGNIYACEALFLAGLDPRTPAVAAASSAEALVRAIRKVLRDAIASGGSSLRDFFHTDGETGYFQHHFQVYGRAGMPCFACASEVSQLRQAGRSTCFCPACQRMPHQTLSKAGKPRQSAALRGTKKAVLGA